MRYDHNRHLKLKPSLFDRIFRKDRYKKIISLRNQIDYMLESFESLDIETKLSTNSYKAASYVVFTMGSTTLNEVGMCRDKGEQAVIDRLTNDRNELLKFLEPVVEVDLSYVLESIREEKINIVIDD